MQLRQAMTSAPGLATVLTLAWLPALFACWYWDDAWLALGSGKPTSLAEIWTRDLWGDGSTPFYRPVLLASLWLDGLTGSPVLAHLQSVLWHVGAAVLLYLLVRRRADAPTALLAAGLWGLHPVQSEAVTWVSARSDPLCAFWAFAALLLLERPGGTWIAALAALLAGCSKEQGLLLPLVYVAWRIAWGDRPLRSGLLAVCTGSGLAWGLRHLAPLYDGPPDAYSLALFQDRWLVGPTTLLSWLVVPWPLTGTASLFAPRPGPWPGALVALLGLVALIRTRPRSAALVALGLFLLVPGVAAMRASVQIGERLLYFPLAFLAVAAAIVLARRPVVALPLFAALLLVLELRLADWTTTERLEARALSVADDPFTWHWVGVLRGARGELKGSFEAHLRAVRGDPPMLWSCAEPVRLLVEVGSKDKARELADSLSGRCRGRASFEDAAAAAR